MEPAIESYAYQDNFIEILKSRVNTRKKIVLAKNCFQLIHHLISATSNLFIK